jgi:hypothetical protein
MLSVFLEKFLPTIVGAILIGVVLVNPKRWDATQRLSLTIAIVAIVVFAVRTISLKVSDAGMTVIQPPLVPVNNKAHSSGDCSASVAGNGNVVTEKCDVTKQIPKSQ